MAVSERQTQKQVILRELKAGRTLTHLRAFGLCGCCRLAARIHDLRQEGYAINSRKPEGESHAEYWMAVGV